MSDAKCLELNLIYRSTAGMFAQAANMTFSFMQRNTIVNIKMLKHFVNDGDFQDTR